ncbi:MAG: site-2 protease family protein [Lachnospiraceae bacterium]|nr:site-2 protease family protein [Lachnospiraceae bacterium]
MSVIWTILAFIVIFSVLVVVHEFGHFIVAKANGIHVKEFAVGMGPRLLHFKRKGTEYALRALPFGGACVFEEEDPFEDEEDEAVSEENPMEDPAKGTSLKTSEKSKKDDSEDLDDEEEEGIWGCKFSEAPLAGRIATVLAGPVFNILLGFLLAMLVVGVCGENPPVIGALIEGMPAQEAGLQPGDEIISINGERIYLFSEITLYTITNRTNDWVVKYKRGDEINTVNISLGSMEGRRVMGIYAGEVVDCANIKIFQYSWYEVRYWLKASVKSIGMLFSGRIKKDYVAGPVGMAQVIGNTIQETKAYGIGTVLINLVNIALLLSVNLAIMNLLPFPALDGGRLVFLIAELIFRRKIPKKFEAVVTLVGFGALLVLMVLVLVNDVSRFFR